MSLPIDLTNSTTTITSIKRYIYGQKGKLSQALAWSLVEHVTTAYEIKGVDRPRACAVSFVFATIRNAQRR